MLRCFWQANAHEQFGKLQIHFIIELMGWAVYFVLFKIPKGAVFFVCNF